MSSSQAACGTATLGTSSSAPSNGRPARLACTSTPSGGHLLAAHQSSEFTVVPPPMRCHNCARSSSATCGAHEDIDDAPLTKVVSAMHLRTSEMISSFASVAMSRSNPSAPHRYCPCVLHNGREGSRHSICRGTRIARPLRQCSQRPSPCPGSLDAFVVCSASIPMAAFNIGIRSSEYSPFCSGPGCPR